jgi:hypothetical protein
MHLAVKSGTALLMTVADGMFVQIAQGLDDLQRQLAALDETTGDHSFRGRFCAKEG